jgi:hypothetical protein
MEAAFDSEFSRIPLPVRKKCGLRKIYLAAGVAGARLLRFGPG